MTSGISFLFSKGIISNTNKPATITMPVFTTHISQPKERPVVAGIAYMLSVCITKKGNVPKPPGVTIMAKVANAKTEQAALKPRCDVPSIA